MGEDFRLLSILSVKRLDHKTSSEIDNSCIAGKLDVNNLSRIPWGKTISGSGESSRQTSVFWLSKSLLPKFMYQSSSRILQRKERVLKLALDVYLCTGLDTRNRFQFLICSKAFFFVPFFQIIPLSESSYLRISGRRFLDFWGGLLVFFMFAFWASSFWENSREQLDRYKTLFCKI